MVSLEFSESDEWTDDDDVALHPLSAAARYAKRLNRTRLYHCTKVRIVGSLSDRKSANSI